MHASPAKSVCHSCPHPCSVQIIPEDTEFSFSGSTYEIEATLHPDNTVTSPNMHGNWSMVYDQALFVDLGLDRFVANFKYEVKDSVTNYEKLTSASLSSFNSECAATMVGFLQVGDSMFKCAYANQTRALSAHKAVESDTDSAFIAENTQQMAQVFAQTSEPSWGTNLLATVAAQVNAAGLSWSASSYAPN